MSTMLLSEKVKYIVKNYSGFWQGVGITLLLAMLAKLLTTLPFMNILGQLVIAIILGIAYKSIFNVPQRLSSGISFSSKKLLRYGIILLGMRLNLRDIIHAGPRVAIIAIINIVVTIFVVYGLTRLFKVEGKLGMLTACGTAICGAAAVVAISPQMNSNDEETAVAAATVAILGTIFTIMYTLLYPFLGLSPAGYGIFSGATLHEIAHVIAATSPVGQQAVDLAVIVKLTRVAMLVPVAIVIGIWTSRMKNNDSTSSRKDCPGSETTDSRMSGMNKLPIPWFIFGFLLMSGVNTLAIVPTAVSEGIVTAAYLLIAMAMSGLGLGVELSTFRRLGIRAFFAAGIGSVVLSVLSYLLIGIMGLA
jgi:uncharacterized integral membrane protein (TIGR00698 family)